MSQIKSGIVVRDDRYWQGHPDVAFFRNKIYVAYRESENHKSDHNTKICITSSFGYEDTFRYPKAIFESEKGRYNCPRLKVVEHRLWAICDYVINTSKDDFINAENKVENTFIHLSYTEDGERWTKPIVTPLSGIVPDRIFPTGDGHYLIATHHFEKNHEYLAQDVWRTDDLDSNRWSKHNVAYDGRFNLCEGSICYAPDNHLICMMRENSQRGLPAVITFSEDHGKTWGDLYETRLFGCHRPVLGRLKSGNYLVTYREQSSNFEVWAKNTFAALMSPPNFMQSPYCSRVNILPIEHDKGLKSDGGYTGWIQLENGCIFIVNYVKDKVAKPFIKWYSIREVDF